MDRALGDRVDRYQQSARRPDKDRGPDHDRGAVQPAVPAEPPQRAAAAGGLQRAPVQVQADLPGEGRRWTGLEGAEQLAGVGVGPQDRPVALPGGIGRTAEAVVALMDALDGRLHSTAQILLPRVQGGV